MNEKLLIEKMSEDNNTHSNVMHSADLNILERLITLTHDATPEQLAYLAKTLDTVRRCRQDSSRGTISLYRWAVYSPRYLGNRANNGGADLYLGNRAEYWNRGDVRGSSIDYRANALRTLLTRSGKGGDNAMVVSKVSAVDGVDDAYENCTVLFRVKNWTERSLRWKVNFAYSAGSKRRAFCSVNGVDKWQSEKFCSRGEDQVDLSIPSMKTSSIIFNSTTYVGCHNDNEKN